ncbi:MAG: hypothetical protein PHC34_01520 [Candidatus Gastranaerophilales bacterium]|nr:hypothetical protein [Candidatus Gastranaerophilales bacterium]
MDSDINNQEYLLDDNILYFNPLSSCIICRFANKGEKIKNCKAFPFGIPDEIWEGKNDHNKSYDNDNGIQFEERK